MTMQGCNPTKNLQDMICETAKAAGLVDFITADGDKRYMSVSQEYKIWSFQTQLANFLNQCLDNPIP